MGKKTALPGPHRHWPRWVDLFVLLLLATLIGGALLPPGREAMPALSTASGIAVAVQFFISGLRLPAAAAIRGLKAWRLHLVILASTFVLFPLLGLGVAAGSAWYLTHELVAGLLFLAMLPTAVQTATAFTAIARGNTAAAVCAASISNLLGVIATPLLVALVLGTYSGMNLSSVGKIVLQIVAPFVLGQLLHKPAARWLDRWATGLKAVDRGAILLVVYAAFGGAVADGLWRRLPPEQLVVTAGICAAMLALMLWLTSLAGRKLGFTPADSTAVMFCGSEKSLATGLPLSAILFQGPLGGVVILPVIIYHALQLIVCAAIARRLARRQTEPGTVVPEPARV
ncbi:putative sodium/bile acid symporter family (mazG-like) [Arthrobacter sp. 9AX]|uniref:bile acid:sodium symporter family protein n=1 Tax=Arthrobacter sp. 9AX TaxID=2653131 RepID=UPI0012F406C5|nr:bile acid:sodium symporter family protein [Arthrobacter sp. 9AX]VXC16323.1 putative sodium/bile acid symporter family (mazG-like) [Arthrobacter sp. 9AX]